MTVRVESQSEPIPGYRLLDRLGSGGFGEVWRAEAPGGIFKAIKFIFGDLRSPDHDHIRYAEQELKALKRVKQVRHPYLLALDRYDIIDGRLMIVMELADCNLWDRFRECRDRGLPGIPRDELLVYMAETAEVLDLMFDQFALQHLDIKPQNLFLLHNHVKVADFGQVKDLQGVMASVTGGITPVYAAPETFDGIVSRFCDQYSLACVYQELLTGERPFDGASMSQLLMQHIQLPPSLDPSPPCDRPALLRALAKKPEDRWPSVTAFVRALRESGERVQRSAIRGPSPGSAPAPASSVANPADPEQTVPQHGLGMLALETPWRQSMDDTDSHEVLITPAPPELTGPGPLRPALIIGIGQTGLRVLQRLRFDLAERFGPAESTPAVRTLYIDTDADTVEEAGRSRPQERLAALSPGDVCHANLNRAGHYLKPRLNGRNLIEGWFDQQLLYRIPRTPHTMGMRLLGRLAFCDHYRALVNRIQAELEIVLAPESMELTEARTGLCLATNRPRVYIVTGLAGGTGSGMFLDVAYSVRARLKRMGLPGPDVVGLFLVPPVEATAGYPLALGNTYAALTEIHHYSRSDTTFTAHYEDRFGILHESEPPFARCYLLAGPDGAVLPSRTTPSGSGVVRLPGMNTATGGPPGSKPGSKPKMPGLGSGIVAKPGSRVIPAAAATRNPESPQLGAKPYADAAALIRFQLFSPIGQVTEEFRERKLAEEPRTGVTFSTFGLTAFDWPRAGVVALAAQVVSRNILMRWVVPSLQRAREVIPGRTAEIWTRLGLDPDTLLAHLRTAAERALGQPLDEFIQAAIGPVMPKGWLARLPEAEKIVQAFDHLVRHFGSPGVLGQRGATAIEDAVAQAAEEAADGFAHDLRKLGQSFVENSQTRPAAAEELLRQFQTTTERMIDRYSEESLKAAERAAGCQELLAQHIHYRKGMRKQTQTDLVEALQGYPAHRLRAMKCHYLYQLYRAVRVIITDQLDQVMSCRQQLDHAAAVEPKIRLAAPGPRTLLPAGCPQAADAAERLLDLLGADDYTRIEQRVQTALESQLGGLLQACLGTSTGAEQVVSILREEVRSYLDQRLGDANFGGMFADRYPTRGMAETAIGQAYADAEPRAVGAGPWESSAVVVVGAPAGSSGETLRERARCAIPVAGLPLADSRDDLTIYREYPAVPFSALPHLGSDGTAVYRSLPDSNTCSLHSRLDVLRWHMVE